MITEQNGQIIVDELSIKNDSRVLELSLQAVSIAMDDLIEACLKKDGATNSDIAKARGMLPAYCRYAYKPKKADE